MKLLKDISEDISILTEEYNDNKRLYIEGTFMQSNIKNRNGRIYPRHILEEAVRIYNEDWVLKNRATGELSHPNSGSINPDRISHKIISLKQENNDFIGKALILEDMPQGKIVKILLESGVSIGVSSRGMGDVRTLKGGVKEILPNFRLVTAADIVMDPSAPDAFVQHIMEEAEWIFDIKENTWVPQYIDESKELIEKASKAEQTELFFKLFKQYTDKISE